MPNKMEQPEYGTLSVLYILISRTLQSVIVSMNQCKMDLDSYVEGQNHFRKEHQKACICSNLLLFDATDYLGE